MKYILKSLFVVSCVALALAAQTAQAAVPNAIDPSRFLATVNFGDAANLQSRALPTATWTASGAARVGRTAPVPVIRSTPLPVLPQAPSQPDSRGVFSSVAISAARLPATEKWNSVSARSYADLFTDNCRKSGLTGCGTTFAVELRGVSSRIHGMGRAQILGEVNRSVNATMRYRTDSQNWGQSDYWANPTETALKGAGDCEDFAIAKYWLLRSLGYAASDLQIVVLSDTRRQLYHAVLVAHVDGVAYVLDNLSSQVSADTRYPNYVPIMSFAAGKSYIHGFAGRNSAMAALPTDMRLVNPGEGI
jgi:predicted transglutaminase-like cysteine proteinase